MANLVCETVLDIATQDIVSIDVTSFEFGHWFIALPLCRCSGQDYDWWRTILTLLFVLSQRETILFTCSLR